MKMIRRMFPPATLALLACSPWAFSSAVAQPAYPSAPIKIIVPYPAGGASDAVARMIGEKLQLAWGQPVYIDNKPGASGIIGTQATIKSPADGYTLLAHNSVLIQQPAVMEKLSFNPFKDLLPVVMTIRTTNLFVVPNDSPVKSVAEFVAQAKGNPNKASYGSYGIASGAHFQGELLKMQAGVDLAHAPFQGSAPMITNIVGGQLPSAFIDVPSALPHIKSMRPLAVGGPQRLQELPNVPTFAELGYKSFEPMGWHGLFLPAGAPPAVAQKIANEVSNILRMPDVLAKLKTLGVIAGGGTPEEFAQQIKADAPVYAEIAKAANIRLTQ